MCPAREGRWAVRWTRHLVGRGPRRTAAPPWLGLRKGNGLPVVALLAGCDAAPVDTAPPSDAPAADSAAPLAGAPDRTEGSTAQCIYGHATIHESWYASPRRQSISHAVVHDVYGGVGSATVMPCCPTRSDRRARP